MILTAIIAICLCRYFIGCMIPHEVPEGIMGWWELVRIETIVRDGKDVNIQIWKNDKDVEYRVQQGGGNYFTVGERYFGIIPL